jgi:hypothetical protein
MFGPIPSGTRFIRDFGCARVYGTPASLPIKGRKAPLGFTIGARHTAAAYKKANYRGLRQPYTTTEVVLRTSLGPYLVPVIDFPARGLADNLFATMSTQAIMSGAHDITALTGNANNLFGTINSDADLFISPNIRGNASELFYPLSAQGYLFTPRNMQGSSSGFDIGTASNGLMATLKFMQGNNVAFNIGETSDGYLYTYNFTVGTMKFAASLAW